MLLLLDVLEVSTAAVCLLSVAGRVGRHACVVVQTLITTAYTNSHLSGLGWKIESWGEGGGKVTWRLLLCFDSCRYFRLL